MAGHGLQKPGATGGAGSGLRATSVRVERLESPAPGFMAGAVAVGGLALGLPPSEFRR